MRIGLTLLLIAQLFAARAADLSGDEEAKRFRELIGTIEPLGNGASTYTNWSALVRAARVVQTSDPAAMIKQLKTFQEHGLNGRDFDDESSEMATDDEKLFLLLRIVFDLPEAVKEDPRKWLPRFHGYVSFRKEINDDGTRNVAWPITWRNGNPILVSRIAGRQGVQSRYRSAAEFEYFLKTYSMRNLSTFAEQNVR